MGMPEIGLKTKATTAPTPDLEEVIVGDEETMGQTASGAGGLPAASTYGQDGQLSMEDMVMVKVGHSNWIYPNGIETWGSGTVEMGWKV